MPGMSNDWDVVTADCKSCQFYPGERKLIMVGHVIKGISYYSRRYKCPRSTLGNIQPVTKRCPNYMRWLELPIL